MDNAGSSISMVSRRLLWRNTSEYRQLCIMCQEECQRLFAIGSKILPIAEELFHQHSKCSVRQELAVQGNIHRGFYCPSPVYDIIIGNVKRGKILKRSTAKSVITHRYSFDASDRLTHIEYFSQNNLCGKEVLIYDDSKIYGITLDKQGKLSAVSEEVYQKNRIQSYRYATFLIDSDVCVHLHCENYEYDDNGLVSCMVQNYDPMSGIHQKKLYSFEREDCFLSGFYVTEIEGDNKINGYWDGHLFKITQLRKA